ncbi:MAG TPA: hypothetical protein VFT06_03325 [Flavisolibacter sp.]|nr:hypothetical protein [Flavisolibacter sp.]
MLLLEALFFAAPFEDEEAPFLEALLLLLFAEALEAPPFLAAVLLAPLEAPFEELFEAPLAELLPAAFFAVAMLF